MPIQHARLYRGDWVEMSEDLLIVADKQRPSSRDMFHLVCGQFGHLVCQPVGRISDSVIRHQTTELLTKLSASSYGSWAAADNAVG